MQISFPFSPHRARSLLRVFSVKAILALAILALAGSALAPLAAQAAPQTQGLQDPAELETFLDGLMADQLATYHIPGAVISVVKDGELFFAKGYGFADLEVRQPVDPERTLFRVGSVSKLVTWTAVMQLVEQGRLSLDTDVNEYIDFTIPATFPEPITIRHLLTHTPGFEDRGQNLFKLDPQAVPSLQSYLKDNLPARVFPPGRLAAYSNYGAALAGYIVERVSGLPFAEYVAQNIFAPLGMEHSTFVHPLPAGLLPDMSKGYNYVNGAYVKGEFEFVTGYPAGSLSATAADMARFMIAHLQNGRYNETQILEEATAQRMHQQLFTPDPRLEGLGYGFFISTMNGHTVVSHGGDTMLFHSALALIPDQNVGVFVSTNGTGGIPTGEAVLRAFMNRYYPADEPAAVTPPAGFRERIAPYLGQYTLARSNFTTFEKLITGLSPIVATLNDEGYLVVSIMGDTQQFVEVEPGLLQGRYDQAQKLVYRMGESGRHLLLPSAPFAFIKTPWYGTLSLHGLLLVFSLGLLLAALVGWPVAALANRRERSQSPLWARLARWAAVLFALLALAFLFWLVTVFSDVLPAYGVPAIYYGAPAGMNAWMSVPLFLLPLGVLLLVFTVLAWIKGWWQMGGRVFYTLVALGGLAFVFILAYWNFL